MHVVQSAADWQPQSPLDRRQLRPARQTPGAAWRATLGGHRRRRSALHQERSARSRHVHRVLRSADDAERGRSRGRLPAHRHADEQPAARPVQPAERGPPPAGALVLQLREALLRGLQQRLRPGHQWRLQPGGAGATRLGGPAAQDEGRSARSAAEGPLLAAGVHTRAKKVGQLEARALDYLEANPARNGPTWITFLGC